MPLLWLSVAFLLGLLAGTAWQWPWLAWAIGAAAWVVAAFFERRLLGQVARYIAWRRLARLPVTLLLAGVCAGGLRASLEQLPAGPASLAWYSGRGMVQVVGVVNRLPDQRQTTQVLSVAVESLVVIEEGQTSKAPPAVRGLLLAQLPAGREWRYGDRVALEGTLNTLEEAYSASYAAYLDRQGYSASMSYPRITLLQRDAGNPILALITSLRSKAIEITRQLWPMPESALMEGILLGYERNIPEEVDKAFSLTGTAHIIAISGFNISILAGLFVRIFGRFMRRWLAVLLALAAISFYTLLVGAQPAVVRAAIMGAVGLFGPLLGRQQAGVNSLAFVAALMCLFNPQLPWDISFQLSFSGTLGLVLFADPLLSWFTRLLARRLPYTLARKIAQPVGDYLLFTLAAQLTTLPIIAYHFQRVSLSAVLANPLILPIQPLVMILGGLALVAGLAWLPLGQLLAGVIWPLPAYTIRATEALAQLPNGSLVTGPASMALVVLYYGLLFALAAGLLRADRLKGWLLSGAGLVLAALLAVGIWRGVLAAPDGKLHLTLLGLEAGPAALIRAPGGQVVLLNGGSDARALEDALARRLPPLGAKLDMLLITTRYASPLNTLTSIVERFQPAEAAIAGCASSGTARNRLVSALNELHTPLKPLQTGDRVELGQGAVLRVLLANQDGVALLLEWGNFRALLPGGVAPADLARLDPGLTRNASLLLLTPADLGMQAPFEWARLNPAQVAWYLKGGMILMPGWLNLEQAGWLEVVTDGERMWAEAGR